MKKLKEFIGAVGVSIPYALFTAVTYTFLLAQCATCGGKAVVAEEDPMPVFRSDHGIYVYSDGHYVSPRDVNITTYVIINELQKHDLFADKAGEIAAAFEDWNIGLLFEDEPFQCVPGEDMKCWGVAEMDAESRAALLVVVYDPCFAATSFAHELTHFLMYAALGMYGEQESLTEFYNENTSASEVARRKAILETECE